MSHKRRLGARRPRTGALHTDSPNSKALSRGTGFFLCTALTVSGCAVPPGPPGPDGATSGEVAVADNCGRDVHVDQPPERAVSLNQSTTEIMLSLGLQDRMAGTATWTDPVDPELAAANAQVPTITESTPSLESVLDIEPDMALGAYEAVFTDERVASRDRFEQLGVPTYLSPSNCLPEEAPLRDPTELTDIYQEVRDIAQLFDVPERGEALVTDLRKRVAESREKVAQLGLPEDTSVLFWFARTESPYVAGATGSPAIMARELGVRNAYADERSMWPQVSWEDVLRRDPTLLVLGDLTRAEEGDDLGAKVDFLRDDPATENLSAARAQRWLPMSGTALNISLRTVDGIEALADELIELDRQR